MPLIDVLGDSFRLAPPRYTDKPIASRVDAEFDLLLPLSVCFDFYPAYPAGRDEPGADADLEITGIRICRDQKAYAPPDWLFADADLETLKQQILNARRHARR